MKNNLNKISHSPEIIINELSKGIINTDSFKKIVFTESEINKLNSFGKLFLYDEKPDLSNIHIFEFGKINKALEIHENIDKGEYRIIGLAKNQII